MKKKNKIVGLLFTAGLLIAVTAEIVRSETMVLPDSDTSSLGTAIPVERSMFKVNCMPTATAMASIKRLGGEPMIFDNDARDGSLLIVIRFSDGSMNFMRSDKMGVNLCVFGTALAPVVDKKVVLRTPEDRAG